jgi:hypothetical protein
LRIMLFQETKGALLRGSMRCMIVIQNVYGPENK